MYIITTGMNPNEEHLEHHGVLGMKWGVHRYRGKDGKLTEKAKKKMSKIASDEKLSRRQTNLAKNRIKENTEAHAFQVDANSRRLERLIKRGGGKSEKALKLYDAILDGKRAIARNNATLADIDSGKIKAGRDFINQIDFNFGFFANTSNERVIFKDASRDVQNDVLLSYGRTVYRPH